MMTKMHYEEIAQILLEEDAHMQLIERIADFLQTDNPRFNRAKFIRASSTGRQEQND